MTLISLTIEPLDGNEHEALYEQMSKIIRLRRGRNKYSNLNVISPDVDSSPENSDDNFDKLLADLFDLLHNRLSFPRESCTRIIGALRDHGFLDRLLASSSSEFYDENTLFRFRETAQQAFRCSESLAVSGIGLLLNEGFLIRERNLSPKPNPTETLEQFEVKRKMLATLVASGLSLEQAMTARQNLVDQGIAFHTKEK